MAINLEKSAKSAKRFDLEKDTESAKGNKVTLKKKVTLKTKTPEVSNKFAVYRKTGLYDSKAIVTLDIEANKQAQVAKYEPLLPEGVKVVQCTTAKERANLYYILEFDGKRKTAEIDGETYEVCFYQRDIAQMFGLEVNHKTGTHSRISLEQKAEKLAMQLQEVQQAIAAEKKAKAEREERKAIEDALKGLSLEELKKLIKK